MRNKTKSRRLIGGAGLLLLLLLVVIGGIWLWPIGAGGLSAAAHPVNDYSEALKRVQALDAKATEPLSKEGATQLMTHGRKTAKVIVFLHGYTNCPQQFHDLGKAFYDLGYNVLIPRQPHHGYADRMTADQAKLTAEEMAAFTDEAVDIAHGLGDQVVLAGISGGGTAAAWAAQHRSDLDLAVLIAPLFGVKAIPPGATRLAMNIYRLLLPVSFSWWDPQKQQNTPPSYAYPRYSPTVIAQLLRLGFAVRETVSQRGPAAKSVLVVTNAGDGSVDNAATAAVTASWRKQAPDRIRTFEFGVDPKLPHDLIDPNEPDQNTKLVYSTLVRLIQGDRR